MIIWPRYQVISKLYVEATRLKVTQIIGKGHLQRELIEEETHELKISREQQTLLHFELESIFIFSSILLDRIAAATQYYFGKGSGQWRSFEAMKKFFADYSRNKRLSVPDSKIIDLMSWLHENVSEFRHLLVIHKHENDFQVRLGFGTAWSNDENDFESYFNLMLMYPQGDEKPVSSEKPSNILAQLNGFIEGWIQYLILNRQKRNLTPNP